MFGSKHKPQTFREYVMSLTNEGRLNIMNFLSKYGDPHEILNELFSIVPCCQTKKLEVKINERYILWYTKETMFHSPNVFFYLIDDIEYCYHSYCKNGDFSEVSWVKKTGNRVRFTTLNGQDSLSIFMVLQQYVPVFRQHSAQGIADDELMPSFDTAHHLFFQGDTLYERKRGEFTKKITDTVHIRDIQKIIWCKQWYAWDSDASDSWALDVYTTYYHKPLTIFSDSTENANALVQELKRRVPHLLYGPNPEYEQIFKRNPEELMALAKSKTAWTNE